MTDLTTSCSCWLRNIHWYRYKAWVILFQTNLNKAKIGWEYVTVCHKRAKEKEICPFYWCSHKNENKSKLVHQKRDRQFICPYCQNNSVDLRWVLFRWCLNSIDLILKCQERFSSLIYIAWPKMVTVPMAYVVLLLSKQIFA